MPGISGERRCSVLHAGSEARISSVGASLQPAASGAATATAMAGVEGEACTVASSDDHPVIAE